MFFSTFHSAIDAKGRVSVPAPFRAALGGESHVYIWPSFSGRLCLEGGGNALMDDYRRELGRLGMHNPAREAISHSVFGRSVHLKMDEPGRIKLPPTLLAAAGIETDLVFVGGFERFRIWSPERYAEYDAEMSAQSGVHAGELAGGAQ